MMQEVPLNAVNSEYLDWDLTPINDQLAKSIDIHGCLTPITCIKYNHEFYIVDGYQRLRICKSLDLRLIPCVEISSEISILDMVFSLHEQKLNSSVLLRLRFIQQFGVPMNDDLVSQFKLPFYSHIKKDIDRICSLNNNIQYFFYEKGYSLKEMVHLIHYSIPLVETFILDDHLFSFSKRSFDQILDQSAELMKRFSWDVDQLLKNLNYVELSNSNLTPQQRLKSLQTSLHDLCNATLITQNKKIKKLVSAFKSDHNATIQYDESLENVDLSILLSISSYEEYESFTNSLASLPAKSKIKALLESL